MKEVNMALAENRPSKGAASSPIEDTSIRLVAGLFPDLHTAKDAVKELKAAGFTDKDIGLAMRNPGETERPAEVVTGTRATDEAATGAVGGGVLGGLAGLLVAAGVVAIPGLGSLLAGGSLASLLGSTGASVAAGVGLGATAGGLVGALVGFDIPELEARHFEAAIRSGRVLVLVKARTPISDALTILQRHGGEIDMSGERHSSDHSDIILI
jgi:hypothetical protein